MQPTTKLILDFVMDYTLGYTDQQIKLILEEVTDVLADQLWEVATRLDPEKTDREEQE